MKFRKWAFMAILFLAICPVSAWSDIQHTARPGSINYFEGQASIGAVPVTTASVGTVELEKGQVLTTQAGKVEILLTPGIFLRIADNSAVKMISPDLTNTEVELENGRAIIEAIDLRKENLIRLDQNGATSTILKKGLYDFDADHSQVRVFDGEVQVQVGIHTLTVKGGHMAALGTDVPLKSQGFSSRVYQDEFYRFSSLRSGYLSEASIDVARTYIGTGPGWYGPGWVGWGWYWNPWFSAYTFLPGDGIFFSPFGWGFYAPVAVYYSPYFFGPHMPHAFGEFHGPYGHGYGEPRMGVKR